MYLTLQKYFSMIGELLFVTMITMSNSIHNSVHKFRKEKSLTQEFLANKVGVSRQTIIALEKGNYTPSLMLAFKISKFFKKNIEEIFQYK